MWRVMPCLVLLSYVTIESAISGVLVSMKGTEFIAYDVQHSHNIRTTELEIVFKFKTIDPAALLMFSVNTFQEDYISLELLDGKLRYKVRLGETHIEDSLEDSVGSIVVGSNLNDYKWHVIQVNQNYKNITLRLDSETTFAKIGGPYSYLDLNHKVYFGGTAHSPDISKYLSRYKITSRKYYGCLKEILFNPGEEVDILYGTKYSSPQNRFTVTGDLGWNKCEEVNFSPITFRSWHHHSLLPSYQTDSLSISLQFRTYISDGLLYFKESHRGRIVVSLCLTKGTLEFRVHVREQSPLIIRKGMNLHDGVWHKVYFFINNDYTKFRLEDYDEVTDSNMLWQKLVEFDTKNSTLGGGAEHIMQGFVGCMYDIWIDNSAVDYSHLGPDYLFGVVINRCHLEDKCLFTPCKNGGTCTQDYFSFKCDCTKTKFGGRFCDKTIYQPSCQAYKDLGLLEDAYCTIDADGDGEVEPVKVLCNVTRLDQKAVTIYRPTVDQTNLLVADVNEVMNDMYVHELSYGPSAESFDTYLEKASKCRQYVQFRCKNAYLMKSPRGPADTFWSGRMGNKEEYWGGAAPDSGRCGCANSKKCADNRTDIFCNCDAGDSKWREDSGYFREVDRLPVFQLYFKLTANQSFFTVGDLECEYPSTLLPTRFSKERILKSSCTPLNQPTSENKTLPVFGEEAKDIKAKEEHMFSFNTHFEGSKASTSQSNLPFRRKNYVPPTKARKSEKGVELSIAKDVIVPVIILLGVLAGLLFIFCLVRMIIRSRMRPTRGPNTEYEEYKEESNRCSLFFRTSSSRYENKRTTVQEIDRGYDKNALLELRTKYTTTTNTRPPPNRLHLEEGSYVDYDYDDDDDEDGESMGSDRNKRRVNETLHIDMNYKRRKKRFWVFF